MSTYWPGLMGWSLLGAGLMGAGGEEEEGPPSALGHEQGWIYAAPPTSVLLADEINQFLQLHGVIVVAQGTPVVTVSGGMTTWQTLGIVDQPFVAPPNIGWLRIPLTSTNLSPTDEPGWENAAPVTVSLFTNDGGVPGTLVASTTVPAEQIEGVQGAAWPEPDDLLFGPAVIDPQSSLPQLPGTGWAINTSLSAGQWGVLFATQEADDTQMWVVPYDGQDLGGWIDGSALPVSGLSQAVYAPNAQAVVVLSAGVLYAATFAQTGVVGSWQQLPIITGLGDGLIGILSYQGSDYLIVVSTAGTAYYAPLSTSASITSWTEGPSFPVEYSAGGGYQVGDDLVFIVQSSGVATLVSLEIPGGGWSVSGTLTASSTDILGVIGQAVITTNGTAIDATTLTELGTAPWSLPVPLAADGDAVSLLAFESGTGYVAFWLPVTEGVAGYQQPVYVPSWVNVPFPESLSEDDTYHLVLSAANALTVGVAVPVADPSDDELVGLLYNGTEWVDLGGVVPIIAFYTAAGAPLALIAVGKTTILWFDTPSGALTTTVELVGDTSQSRVVSYADDVLTSVA